MKFQLAIKDATDIERLKELLHTHPLRSDSLNEIAKPIFKTREAVDKYWGDYVPKNFPYVFIGYVEDGVREGGFGEGSGHQVLQLIPVQGSHTFEQLDRIKSILEDSTYLKICKEIDQSILTHWDDYCTFDLELEACQRATRY